MTKSISALIAAAGLAAGAAVHAGTVTVSPLVMAGDFYLTSAINTGFASVNRLEVNNAGTWLIHSTLVGGQEVLLSNTGTTLPGNVLLAEGDAAAGGQLISFFGRLSINTAGNNSFYTTASSPADSAIHYNTTTQVIIERDIATALQFSPNTPYIGFFGGILNDDGQMLVMASVDDPLLASTVDRALVRVDNPAAAATETVLLKESDEVVPGRLLVDFQTSPHTYSFALGGRVLATVDMDGDTTNDTGLLYHNGTAWSFVAREGDPVPGVPGRNYGNFYTTTNPSDINNAGVWAARIGLNAPTSDDTLIIRNGTDVIAREGSPVPGLPDFNITGFPTGAVKIDDRGNVFYWAAWDDRDTSRNSGLFRNGELIVQKGVTVATNGELITYISEVQDNFSISRNGRWLVFEGDLTDLSSNVRRGTLLVEIQTGCPADFNDSGSVTVQDIFDFLAAYFSNSPSADFNGQGGVTVQDIFDFLAAYFTPCN